MLLADIAMKLITFYELNSNLLDRELSEQARFTLSRWFFGRNDGAGGMLVSCRFEDSCVDSMKRQSIDESNNYGYHSAKRHRY